MGILDSLTNVAPQTGQRIVISGVEGVGKTTLAAGAPRAILVPLEQGSSNIKGVYRIPGILEYYDHVMAFLDEVMEKAKLGQFPFQSIVFDSVTALEKLIHTATLMKDPNYGKGNVKALTMEAALGGYGKAYGYANELFQNFLNKCDELAIHGKINIVLTCHVFSAKIVDPTVGEYDSWDLLLHSPKNQKTYGKREMLTQWADLIGFLREPIMVTETKKIVQGISANKGRVIAVSRQPSFTAKNRYGMTEDISIPPQGGWNTLAAAIYQHSGVDIYNREAT